MVIYDISINKDGGGLIADYTEYTNQWL